VETVGDHLSKVHHEGLNVSPANEADIFKTYPSFPADENTEDGIGTHLGALLTVEWRFEECLTHFSLPDRVNPSKC